MAAAPSACASSTVVPTWPVASTTSRRRPPGACTSAGTAPSSPRARSTDPGRTFVRVPGVKRVIAHLDCDAFYATVELLRRPELAGKPVIVAGSGPRAVVTTASYEARKFGVGSAMPASQARRLCPTAIVIPPDFSAYREKSREVWDLVRVKLERLQSMGLDEAYA